MRTFYVYILTNKSNDVLYIGMTSNLYRRIREHKKGLVEGFTKKYNVKKLVYVEFFDGPYAAIEKEKDLKRWRCEWKIRLIEENNPKWRVLTEKILI